MKLVGESPIPRDVIQKILDAPLMPYADDNNPKEEEQCKELVDSLTEQQLEFAAQSSYAYWLASISDKPPTPQERVRMATREARRFLFRNPYEKGYREFHDTADFRRDEHVGILRACFTEGIIFETEEETRQVEKFRSYLSSDLKKQESFVRGHDKDGLALVVMKPRTDTDTDDDAFVATMIYVVERSLACTESLSVGEKEKMNVILDFGEFYSSLAPPLSAVKAIVTILQHRYSDRLKRLVIIDPPFWMRTMYSLVKPFLDPDTLLKFVMVSGDAQKMDKFSEFVNDDQAMPFMLPTAKLSETIDIDRSLKAVPFHCLYDDKCVALETIQTQQE